ncbi:MAG: hypothetical protein FJ271_07120 [Planctomycetes bacterium]|nr:hypothetical protein [Planctomycetota bacterium]
MASTFSWLPRAQTLSRARRFRLATYHAAPGQHIGGLVDGQTYTVVASADPNNPFAFGLDDGGNRVDFNLSPQMLIGGTAYDFNTYPWDATITFPNPPAGLANGTPMVYQSALGRTIEGLTDGQTYYAVVNPFDASVVRLTTSALDAALAFQEGLNAYYQATRFYAAIYDPAYQAWLTNHPGDIFGAQVAGNQAVEAATNGAVEAQDWFSAGTGSARNYPYFSTAAGTPVAITQVDPTTSTINFAVPLTGTVASGDMLTYHAVAGLNIGGLADGTQYKAVLSNNDMTLSLTDLSDQPITLDTNPKLIRGNGDALDFSVNASGEIVIANPPGNLANGEQLTYQQAFLSVNAAEDDGSGGVYTGLTDGNSYFVVLTPTAGTILLSRSAADAAAAAIALASNNTQGVMDNTVQGIELTGLNGTAPLLVNLGIGAPLMSGTSHTLTPLSNGINITANLRATDTGDTSAMLGFTPTLYDLLNAGEVLPAYQGILGTFKDFSPNSADPAEDAIVNNLPRDNAGQPVTDGPSFNVAGSFGVQYVTNTVQARVGGSAVLKSNQNISVTSSTTQDAQNASEASIYQPDSASNASSFAAAVVIGIYLNTVETTIDDGATLDAAQQFTATANLTYPFVCPLLTGAGAETYFAENPIQNFDAFLDGDLGLDTLLFNTWARAVASGNNNTWSIGGAVGVMTYTNVCQATVGDVNLNQDAAYTSASQTVERSAETSMEFVRLVGVFDLFIAPEALTELVRDGNKLAFFNPFGSENAKGGIGGAIDVIVASNTTVASIGGGARIAAAGGITVTANTYLVEVALAQSGAEADNFGFAGTVAVLDINNTTTAQVGPGVTITGGTLKTTATDSTTMVNVAGSIEKGEHIGFGFTATTNKLSRDSQAIVGAGSGDTPAPSSINLSGDLELTAKNSGALVSASFAAAIESGDPNQQAAAANGAGNGAMNQANANVAVNPIPNMNGGANGGVGNNNPGNSGVAVSGDAAVTLISKDNAHAFINDQQAASGNNIVANNVKLTAENTTAVGSFAGSVAAATIANANNNVAIAGSFTWNTIHSDTQAYIANTILQANSITLEATRSANLISITAGVAAATGTSAVGVAGSVSLSFVTHTIAAYIKDSKTTVADDTDLTATDRSLLITVAGGVGYGGKAGVGAAAAVNVVTNTTRAYIEGSTVNSTNGAVNINARNENPNTDARIIALTGTVGINSQNNGGAGAGMVSVNIIANTTQAYIADSTINLGSGDVTVHAEDTSWIISVGFAVAVGTNLGIGVAFGYNEFKRQKDDDNNDVATVTAYVSNSSINSGGKLTVKAVSTFLIGTGSLSGDVARSLSLAGNASVNIINTTTDAHISNNPVTGLLPRIDVTGAIVVEARDNSTLVSVSGSGAAGTSQAAFGAAFSYNLIDNDIVSYIDGESVQTGSTLAVTATSSPLLVAIALSGDGAENYAAGGAITVNRITNTTDAHISGGATVTAADAVTVSASDSSALYVVAIGVDGASIAAGGAGLAANAIGDITGNGRNIIKAYIDASTVTSTGDKVVVSAGFDDPSSLPSSPITIANGMGASGNQPLPVVLPADMTTQIFNLSIGGAGAQNFGFGGALSLNYSRNTVTAGISGGAIVNAAKAIIVDSGDTTKITSIAGAVGLAIRGGQSGRAVSVGISVAVNNISNDNTAQIDASTATAAAGVSVATTTAPTILAITVAGAGSGTSQGGGIAVAGAGAGSGNTINNTMNALISGGSSVTNNGSAFAVEVVASDDTHITADGGGVTLGLTTSGGTDVTIGAAAAINSVTNNITASINASTVDSAGAVDVEATSTERIFALAIGFAGAISAGDGGGLALTGAGSGSGNTMNNSVEASIVNSNGSHAVTTGNSSAVTVQANDHSTVDAYSGAAAIAFVTPSATGASAAIGVSVSVNKITNHVSAIIDSSDVTADGAVNLSATSTATIQAITVAGGVGIGGGSIVFVGAGAGSQDTVNNTVQALLKGSGTIRSGHAQAVTLTATDSSTINGDAGGLSLGFNGGQDGGVAGALGAAAVVNNVSNITTASSHGATVISDGAVNATASSDTARIFAVTVGVQGALGIGGQGNFSFAGSGSGSGNRITNTIEASVSGGASVTSNNGLEVTLSATDNSTIVAGAGALGVSIAGGQVGAATLAVAASIVVNDIGNTTSAFIDNATVTSAAAVNVTATETANIKAVSIGASAAVSVATDEISIAAAFGGVGATATNTITNNVHAYIQNDAMIGGSTITVSATDSPTINSWAVGGNVTVSGGLLGLSVGIAVGLANNTITDSVLAHVGKSGSGGDATTLTSSGATTVNVNAPTTTTTVNSLAVAASVTGSISIGGALVGVGGHGNITTGSTLSAYVQNGATIAADGLVTISAMNNATYTSRVGSGALSFAIAGASIGVSLGECDIGDTVSAYIDGGMVTSTTNDVDVTAATTTNITMLAVSTALAISIGAAAVGSRATATDRTVTAAYVIGAAHVTAGAGAVNVSATSKPTLTASAPGGDAGLVGIGAMFATADLEGKTQAYIGEGPTIEAATVSISCMVDSSDVTATIVVVSVGGIGALGANATSTIAHVAEAFIGPEAGSTASGAATSITATSGQVKVEATATHAATANADGGSGGGLIDVGVLLVTTNLGGSTSAYAGGNTTMHATSVDIASSMTTTSTATAVLVGISATIGGGGANVQANDSHDTSAYISSGQFTVTGGAVNVTATTNATATAKHDGGQGSVFGVIAVMITSATISGDTAAYVAEGAQVAAGALNVAASAASQSATATSILVAISFASGGGCHTSAAVTGTVAAYAGPEAGTASTTATMLSVAGDVTIQAESNASATANSDGGDGGAVEVEVLNSTTDITGDTRAYAGDGVSITADNLTIRASAASRDASGGAYVVGVGIAGGDGSHTTTTVSGTVEAFVGAQAGSTGNSAPVLTIDGAVVVQADSTSNSNISVTVGAGGLIAVGAATSDAIVDQTTRAYVAPNAMIGSTTQPITSLAVTATAVDLATDTVTIGSGGGAAGRGTDTQSHVTANVQAYRDTGVSVNASDDVTVQAESTRAESHATAKSYGGGVVDVGVPNSKAYSTTNVSAYLGSQATVNAGGNVSVNAFALSDPSGTTFNDDIQSVNVPRGEIVFPSHGLQSGDQVAYDPGPTPIQTPSGPLQNGLSGPERIYKVIVVDANTLQLGDLFAAGAVNAGDPQSTGAGFVRVEGVDPARNVIRFFAPHFLQTGDAVVYENNGNADIGGLTSGVVYFVRAIDANTIKLYATLAEAMAAFASFDPATSVSGNTVTFNTLNFQDGDRASYLTPAPTLFQSTAVNASYSGNPSGTNYIYVGQNHGYQSGDAVVYEADGSSPITGLTPGVTYYAVFRDNFSIQLAASHADAVASTPTVLTLTPDTSPAAAAVNLLLVRPAIGGLSNAITYHVVNASATSFQLAATPGGTPIPLNAGPLTGISGQHQIGRDGIALTPSVGFQQFRIDFTSASTSSPTGDKLFGPGGVSLRQLNPPAGTGISSAVATGGSGGFVEVDEPTARVFVTPTVTAYIAAQMVNAGGNVVINSVSKGNTATNADNSGGGFVEVGDADSSSSFNNSSNAYVGMSNGSSINGSGVQITAQGSFTVWADTQLHTNVYTKSDGGGFVATTHADGTSSGTSTSSTTVGSNALITANTVAILASGTHMTPEARTRSHSGGLFGSATADSTVDVTSTASVVIGGGATRITGFQGVDVRAYHEDFEPDADADGHFDGIGSGHSDENYDNHLNDHITAGAGATVVAGVRTPGTPLEVVSGYNALALLVDGSDFGSILHTSQDRTIYWDANVSIFGGPDPTWIVDANGAIVTAINVSVNDGPANPNRTSGHIDSPTIVVNPIVGLGGGQVLFTAEESVSNAASNPYPLFDFLQNVAAVTIINQSSKDLEIQEINVADGGAGQVTLDSAVVNFMFDIDDSSSPAVVDIQNQNTAVSDSNIILTNLINNPIGQTTISNVRGDIVAQGSQQVVRSNALDLSASGNIGTSTSGRVNVDLVQSFDSVNNELRATEFSAVATAGDVFLNITGRRRDTTGGTFNVLINEIRAAGEVDVLLQTSVYDPPSGGSAAGVEVIDIADPSLDGLYHAHFHPDPNPLPPANLDPGVFADTGNAVPIASAYDIRQRNQAGALTGNPGLVAGGDIRVVAAHPLAGDPRIDITGITQLAGAAGRIDTLTNGDITYTEFGGGAMRIGTVQSNNGNVQLTNHDQATPGQDLDVQTAIIAAGTMLLQVGDNVTTAAGSTLTAGTSSTLLVDYVSPDPDPGVGSIVNINGAINSPLTQMTGHADNDTFNLNDADSINAALTTAIVNVNGGGGSNNLKVDDSGDANTRSGGLTFETVTGLGMGGSGVHYSNIQNLEVDLSQGGTTFFDITSTNLGTPTLVRGGAGNDNINVGSSLAADNGNLNDIQGALTIIGNGGSDSVEVNDHANADGPPAVPGNDPAFGSNYLITPTSVSNDGTPVNFTPQPPLFPRTFAGITFNATGNAALDTVTYLRLDCTDRTNRITVQPSTITKFFVNGTLPEPGLFRLDGGDFLQLDTSQLINGTGFRRLHITGLGAGFWTFVGPPGATEYAREVQFESIERFNHVGIVVTGTGANRRSLPLVRVYNDETNQLQGQIMAYQNRFRGGVRVAVADVNADGLPDIIVVPGPGMVTTLKVFSGAGVLSGPEFRPCRAAEWCCRGLAAYRRGGRQ